MREQSFPAAFQEAMTRKRMLTLAALVFLMTLSSVMVVAGSTISCGPNGLARIQIRALGAALDQYRTDVGRYPVGLEQLIGRGPKRLGPYVRERNLLDPWGRLFYYRMENSGRSFALFTLGRDGRIGGDEANQDIGIGECADCSR
jgi:type II secretory pathway pseudopilin PulG